MFISGENEGAAEQEVHLRQMFYCEREHQNISRKVKRRKQITESQIKMINDAKIDPSSVKQKKYGDEEKRKLLELLDVTFPGIDKENPADDKDITVKEGTPLNANSAESAVNEMDTVCDSLKRASLRMATSLDNCFTGLTDYPTAQAVQQRQRHTITEGMIIPDISRSAAKDWCTEVAQKLSSHVSSVNTGDVTVKSSIAKVQSIIEESGFGSVMDAAQEEMKLSEDEIVMSQTQKSDSQSNENDLNSSKLVDWVTDVASQLEALAVELDDEQESLAFSEHLSVISQEESGSSFDGIKDPPGPAISGRSSGMMTNPRELQSRESSNSYGRPSDPDEVMWESILSKKEEPEARGTLSHSSQRVRQSSSISTVKDALPRSKSTRKSTMEPLLRTVSHGHSQQMKMQTSLSTTLVYLSVIMVVFTVGAFVFFQIFQETTDIIWAMVSSSA